MGSNSSMAKIGSWSFIFGVLIAIGAGVIGSKDPIVISLLIALGVVVGFLNVTGKETTAFLLASVSLVIVTTQGSDYFGKVVTLGTYLVNIFGSIMTFVVPATIVVAMKAIYALAADE